MLRNWSKWSISFRSHFSKRNFSKFRFEAKISISFRNDRNFSKSIEIDWNFDHFRNFVEISINFDQFRKFRPNFHRFQNFQPNFDQFLTYFDGFFEILASISTKFWPQFRRNFVKILKTIEIDRNFDQFWSKFRNFSKFRKMIEISINFDQFRKFRKIWKLISINFDRFHFLFRFEFRFVSFRKSIETKCRPKFRNILPETMILNDRCYCFQFFIFKWTAPGD